MRYEVIFNDTEAHWLNRQNVFKLYTKFQAKD